MYAFRFALIVGAAVLFAACGGSQPPMARPSAVAGADAARGRSADLLSKYAVLFSFDGSNGATPFAGVTNVHGTLYGTTSTGGGGTHCADSEGCGTIFSVTPSGKQTVLYTFLGGRDGDKPNGALTNVNGTLYGTTQYGGFCHESSLGCGTIFSVTTAGKENVLYRFPGHPGGEGPSGWLINLNGTLYGTTEAGGIRRGGGTVFSITPAGKERIVDILAKNPGGSGPSPLVAVNGTLYGTDYQGGTHGYGVVFGVTLAGKEHVLYNFSGPPDGAYPTGSLINVNDTLYGTTSSGGGKHCFGSGDRCGTFFKITTVGKEQVLHRFMGSPHDGGVPNGELLDIDGLLYGTTLNGGTRGSGTVFSITTSGKENVLHSFGFLQGFGGRAPTPGLAELNQTLYGTTYLGGDDKDGTAFALRI